MAPMSTSVQMIRPVTANFNEVHFCTAGLMYLSMQTEDDTSLTQEERDTAQTVISIARCAVLVFSLLTGSWVSGSNVLVDELQAAIGVIQRFIGKAASRVAAWLQKLSHVLRVQQWQRLMQQVDRFLRAVGLGGATVITMGVKDSLLKLADALLDFINSLLQALRKAQQILFNQQ
eukprot:TRINITY_DN1921_c0_g1_i1.p1 TRINITY_DN1921_c0_g1~~TRINITY_DN1921_c0_g1_i1.p1  ORF type:complete len:175 (+),score=24.91 TRINITY_DN1921_c0_g1_i1:350-874(+)